MKLFTVLLLINLNTGEEMVVANFGEQGWNCVMAAELKNAEPDADPDLIYDCDQVEVLG